MADHPSSDAAGGQSDGPGEGLAARLAGLSAGPELLTALIAVELSGLDACDAVAVITAWERLARWVSAAQLAAMAELPERDEYRACRSPQDSEALHSHDPVDPAGDELSLALQLSPGRAKTTLVQAQELTAVLPGTLAALSEGKIDVRRAGKIADHTRILDVEARRRVEAAVLPKAHRQTVTQLERALQRAVIVADPAAAKRRRETASKGRRVERPRPATEGGSDGQAYLSLVGPAEDVIALYTAVDAAARHQRVLEKVTPTPGSLMVWWNGAPWMSCVSTSSPPWAGPPSRTATWVAATPPAPTPSRHPPKRQLVRRARRLHTAAVLALRASRSFGSPGRAW